MNILYLTTSVRFKIMLHAYRNWIKKEDLVLDVGCGNGIVAKLVKDHFAVNMTACDINNYLIYDLPFITIGSNGLDQLKKGLI